WRAALAMLALTLGLLAWPGPLAAIQQTDDEASAALSSALRILSGVAAADCITASAQRPCVTPVEDRESLSRGIAKFGVSAGPGSRGSRLVVLGRLADGS